MSISTRLSKLEKRAAPAGYFAPEWYEVDAGASPEVIAQAEADAESRARARGWTGRGIGYVEVLRSEGDETTPKA
jgi:hypothetical protein